MTEQPLPPGNVDAPAGASAERIKRRQYLLLAGIAGLIVAGTVLSVSLTGSGSSSHNRGTSATTSAARTTNASAVSQERSTMPAPSVRR